MTALVQDRANKAKTVKHDLRPIASGVKAIKGGSCMCITSGTSQGYFAPADSGKSGVVVGIFDETVDNTSGADGAVSANVDFQRERVLQKFANDTGTPITAANREALCYALDDQTVTGAAGNVTQGVVYDLDATGVWVEIDAQPPGADSDGPAIQSGTGVLVAGVSANISANISASSRIMVTAKDVGASTAVGRLEAKAADRATGTPGHFKVTATKPADGTTETGDVSTFDWVVVG